MKKFHRDVYMHFDDKGASITKRGMYNKIDDVIEKGKKNGYELGIWLIKLIWINLSYF